MKKQTSVLLLAFVVATFGSFCYAEENIDLEGLWNAAAAAANQPVVPNNKPIVIGQMDPNALYEPGLVVYDPASKHIVIVDSQGQAHEHKGIIKNGEVVQYTNSGILLMRCPVNAKNKLHGTAKRFDKNGFVFHVSEYKDGLREGKLTTYYPDGKLATELTFKNDVGQGSAKSYYPNGQLMSQANYINGLPDSASFIYTEQGEIANDNENEQMKMMSFFENLALQQKNNPEMVKALQAEYDDVDDKKILKANR